MSLDLRAFLMATLIGSVLQTAMVVAGHSNRQIANLFAVGGMGLSLIAGIIYVMRAPAGSVGSALTGGMLAGAACAFVGILVSYLLKDVPASLLALGTVSSAVTGAIGGWVGRFFA